MSGEKSEEPTPKRLRDSREKGQVAKSQDLSMALLFLALTMVLLFTADRNQAIITEMMLGYFQEALAAPSLDADGVYALLRTGLGYFFAIIGPILAVAFVFGAAVVFFQVGPLFTMKPLEPKLEKLDMIKGFKNKFFSAQTYIELAKSCLKIAVVGILVYFIIKGAIRDVALTVRQPIEASSALTLRLMGSIATKVALLFLVIGTADVFVQRWQHLKQLKMSKDEVKREHKQQEGDPTQKGQRKQLHQEILQHSMIEDVKSADVIIVNPTHLAIALRYKQGEMGAPQVAAKGERLVAKQIIEVAKRYNIPIMRNVPLAHALIGLEIGEEVPEELYAAVAEVLTWVFEQKREADESVDR